MARHPLRKPYEKERPVADYENTTQVSAPADTLFDYLADIDNLPAYFARMKSARPVDGGDAVHTVAEGPDGQTVEGEAWFRVDRAALRIEWGSQGESDYSGYLDVTPAGAGSQVEVHISTARVRSDSVQDGVDETVRTIKAKVEAQGVGKP